MGDYSPILHNGVIMNTKDGGSLQVRGILEVYDNTVPDNEELLIKKNAIHDGNMVYHIAKSMIGQDSSNSSAIGWFAFGDAGSEVSNSGRITYRATNTTKMRNELADLYNRVYQKKIDDDGFDMMVSPVVHPTAISDIKIDLILNKGEPFGQLPMDNALQFSDRFVFDEIGLFSNMPDINDSYLLTHVVFHPIQKSLNRSFHIKYTIRFEIV